MTQDRLIKTPEEIAALKEGGLLLSSILGELVAMVRPGITTSELDAHAQKRMKEVGGEPSFLGYRVDRVTVPFNSAVCLSINDEVVHAPATPSREVKSGDLLKLDIGLRYKGMCTDMAVTVPVGDVAPELLTLASVTKESLLAGIGKIRPGAWISDIGKAVDKVVRRAGFSTVKDLCGHGVGHRVHEDPPIPNYFDPGLEPVRIELGMVLAIEPMVNLGREDVRMLRDGWTVVAKDKKHSAHFEVTVVVTEDGMEVATPLPV